MPFRRAEFPVLMMALRRRIQSLLGRERDPHDGLVHAELSPSARHFIDYDTAPLRLSYATCQPDDVAAWQATARAKLAELAGHRAGKPVVEVVREDAVVTDSGLKRQRLYLRARPGVIIPVHLIRAFTQSGVLPVMICLQGTNSGAHLSWGEARFPADLERKAGGYDFAVQAARRGYLAVAVEQACFGERIERQIRPRSSAPCVDAAMHAFLLGRSLLGERCTDVSAVIDWLTVGAVRLAIDSKRIHAMGHSVGGSVALFSAALDERIQAVLACGCIGPIRTTIGRRRDDQGQNVIPGILNWMELADVVALIAPRPLATLAAIDDHIWPASGMEAAIDEARKVYERLGASKALQGRTVPGGHYFRPEPSWQLFLRLLEGQGRA
jgi:dienelactone hydrolase